MKVTQARPLLTVSVCASIVLLSSSPAMRVRAQGGSAPGGFVESATSLTTRPRLSASQIASFLPARGLFTFPAPYNTLGIRLTNGSDCGGTDCVLPVGYSYWRRINNHAGSDTLYAMITLDRTRGGGGPTLFSYSKSTGVTTKVGPVFDASNALSWATGESFYFSATRPTSLYVHEGSRFMRYDVLSRTTELVFDISAEFGPDRYIWQPHSSNDDAVHSFTLRRTSDYAMLGCGVYSENARGYQFYSATAEFDECQVDKSGRFLVIKEQVDGAQGEDNLIVDLATGAQRLLTDPEGAGGHSDEGFGSLVAEDNFAPQPGTIRAWRLDLDPADPANGRVVFQATDWSWGTNHIAHSNARADLAPEQQIVCSSQASRAILPRSNEVLCYKLDGSLQVLVVAPVMTDLDASGGGDDYWKAPKGNLDVTGEYFIWTSNMGSARMDAFIARVPRQLLDGGTPPPGPTPTPEPPPDPTPTPTIPSAVTWTGFVNTAVDGTTLYKSGGCDGCYGGALSTQELSGGDGYVEFTASNASALGYVGFGPRLQGTTGPDIPFALRVQSGYVEVRERGVYKRDVSFVPGELLRIAIVAGQVRYSKNGSVFYTSTAPVSYPLTVDAALYGAQANVAAAVIAAGSSTTPPPPAPSSFVIGDADGDARTDVTVFRPSNGTWYALTSGSGFTSAMSAVWGASGDLPLAGDFDGDGRSDPTVYRPSAGAWYILKSSTGFSTALAYQWGLAGDLPIPADYDGDRLTDVAVFRPSTGTWYLVPSSAGPGSAVMHQWGQSGDVPVPADYDGDGRADLAVFRPSNGLWYLRKSSLGFAGAFIYAWGTNGDVTVPGDYDGDRRADIAVYRPSQGLWYVLTSSAGYAAAAVYAWGRTGDVPVPGDYDGDSRTDVAMFRPGTTDSWFVLRSGAGFAAASSYAWGVKGDVAVLKR